MHFLKNLGFSFIVFLKFFFFQYHSTFLFSIERLNLLVSIPPQKFFVKKIVKNKHNVISLCNENADIHHINILINQLIQFKKLKTYFILDHPIFIFEKKSIQFFQKSKQHQNIQIFSWRLGVLKEENQYFYNQKFLKNIDPHFWFSIDEVKKFVYAVYVYMSSIDKLGEKFYRKNLNQFIREIDNLDYQIFKKFKSLKSKTYLSYHSSLYYYAKRYGLKPIFIEEKNRISSGLKIHRLHKQIKKKKFRFILIDHQHAKIDSLNLNLVKKIYWNPLTEDWMKNMNFITQNLYQNLF